MIKNRVFALILAVLIPNCTNQAAALAPLGFAEFSSTPVIQKNSSNAAEIISKTELTALAQNREFESLFNFIKENKFPGSHQYIVDLLADKGKVDIIFDIVFLTRASEAVKIYCVQILAAKKSLDKLEEIVSASSLSAKIRSEAVAGLYSIYSESKEQSQNVAAFLREAALNITAEIYLKDPDKYRQFNIQKAADIRKLFKDALKTAGIKLIFELYEIASRNAANGFIEGLGLTAQEVELGYSMEIDKPTAEKYFPGYKIGACKYELSLNEILLTFIDNPGYLNCYNKNSFFMSYYPFKYFIPSTSVKGSSQIKDELKAVNRKIITLGSPTNSALWQTISYYNSFFGGIPAAQRPLLIVAPRQRSNRPDIELLAMLSGHGIKVRNEAGEFWDDMSSDNVLILNTSGELLDAYRVSDLCIVGNDRNIIEPLSCGKAILYEEGDWRNNGQAKKIAIDSGAALPLSPATFNDMINGGMKKRIGMQEKAVQAYSFIKDDLVPREAVRTAGMLLPYILLKALEKFELGGCAAASAEILHIKPAGYFAHLKAN